MSELYIKRDDQCGLWYGGNKPRKLEFLLGDALARSSGAVITFGGLGRNHALATAICAGKLELVPVLILVPQPVSESVRRNLLLMGSQGAELVYARGKTSATLAAVRLTLKHLVAGGGRPPYLILPGGSSPVGCLGYVSAALELAEQVKAGELPQPDDIFVPVGSNGTMAGLLVGLRLAEMDTRVVGVRVSDRLPVTPRAVARLANRCWASLTRASPAVPPGRIEPGEVTLWRQYLGKGYGHPTAEGERAASLVEDQEGITLDQVYTAKTMAALVDASEDADVKRRRVLFWHTYNSQSMEGLMPQGYDHQALPRQFHKVFERSL